jgi:AcrR family transcriptional regulator
MTRVQRLNRERAQHRPIHRHQPDPAQEAVLSVSLGAADQVVRADQQRERCTGGVRGYNDVIVHNTVIVLIVSTVNSKPGPASAQRADLTRRLVDEGARILAEQGPAALSLRKLAGAVGVSTMPVYTLFGDKHGLMAAMHSEGFRRLRTQLDQVGQTDEPLADLGRLGLAYRAAALASRHLYRLMFDAPVVGFTPDAVGVIAADDAYRPLVEAVRRAMDAGAIREADADHVALHLWAVAHGMVSLELNRQLPDIGAPEDLYVAALMYAIHPFLPS